MSRKRKLHDPCVFESLPQDVLVFICINLGAPDIAHLSATNHYLKKLCKKDLIWKHLCLEQGIIGSPRSSWKFQFMISKMEDQIFLKHVHEILQPLKLETKDLEKCQIKEYEIEHKIHIPHLLCLFYTHYGDFFSRYRTWSDNGLFCTNFGKQSPCGKNFPIPNNNSFRLSCRPRHSSSSNTNWLCLQDKLHVGCCTK